MEDKFRVFRLWRKMYNTFNVTECIKYNVPFEEAELKEYDDWNREWKTRQSCM